SSACLFGPSLFSVTGVPANSLKVGVIVGTPLGDRDPVVYVEGVVSAAHALAELADPTVPAEDAGPDLRGEGVAFAGPGGCLLGGGGHWRSPRGVQQSSQCQVLSMLVQRCPDWERVGS